MFGSIQRSLKYRDKVRGSNDEVRIFYSIQGLQTYTELFSRFLFAYYLRNRA